MQTFKKRTQRHPDSGKIFVSHTNDCDTRELNQAVDTDFICLADLEVKVRFQNIMRRKYNQTTHVQSEVKPSSLSGTTSESNNVSFPSHNTK